MPKFQLKEFIDSYKDSLGLEGAEQLMKQVLMKAAIPAHQTDFTKDEALRVCRELKTIFGIYRNYWWYSKFKNYYSLIRGKSS